MEEKSKRTRRPSLSQQLRNALADAEKFNDPAIVADDLNLTRMRLTQTRLSTLKHLYRTDRYDKLKRIKLELRQSRSDNAALRKRIADLESQLPDVKAAAQIAASKKALAQFDTGGSEQ